VWSYLISFRSSSSALWLSPGLILALKRRYWEHRASRWTCCSLSLPRRPASSRRQNLSGALLFWTGTAASTPEREAPLGSGPAEEGEEEEEEEEGTTETQLSSVLARLEPGLGAGTSSSQEADGSVSIPERGEAEGGGAEGSSDAVRSVTRSLSSRSVARCGLWGVAAVWESPSDRELPSPESPTPLSGVFP